jgi:hypothetical protein
VSFSGNEIITRLQNHPEATKQPHLLNTVIADRIQGDRQYSEDELQQTLVKVFTDFKKRLQINSQTETERAEIAAVLDKMKGKIQ